MPPRQASSCDPTSSGRGEQRPTLPPIRQIFGRECTLPLAQQCSPHNPQRVCTRGVGAFCPPSPGPPIRLSPSEPTSTCRRGPPVNLSGSVVSRTSWVRTRDPTLFSGVPGPTTTHHLPPSPRLVRPGVVPRVRAGCPGTPLRAVLSPRLPSPVRPAQPSPHPDPDGQLPICGRTNSRPPRHGHGWPPWPPTPAIPRCGSNSGRSEFDIPIRVHLLWQRVYPSQ